MVELKPNPAYKVPSDASAADKKRLAAAWSQIKAEKPKTVTAATAKEAVINSGGMYTFVEPDEPETSPVTGVSLENMPLEDLKVLMLQLGVKTEKQMTRSQVIQTVRSRLDQVNVVEDDELIEEDSAQS